MIVDGSAWGEEIEEATKGGDVLARHIGDLEDWTYAVNTHKQCATVLVVSIR